MNAPYTIPRAAARKAARKFLLERYERELAVQITESYGHELEEIDKAEQKLREAKYALEDGMQVIWKVIK